MWNLLISMKKIWLEHWLMELMPQGRHFTTPKTVTILRGILFWCANNSLRVNCCELIESRMEAQYRVGLGVVWPSVRWHQLSVGSWVDNALSRWEISGGIQGIDLYSNSEWPLQEVQEDKEWPMAFDPEHYEHIYWKFIPWLEFIKYEFGNFVRFKINCLSITSNIPVIWNLAWMIMLTLKVYVQ